MNSRMPNVAPRSGLVTTDRMKELLARPGFLSSGTGGQELRNLYYNGSIGFTPEQLSEFGKCCYIGALDYIRREVEQGRAPDLTGTETPYLFSYATLIISGFERVQGPANGGAMQHLDTLKYLISCGLPVDIPDICSLNALHHSLIRASMIFKPQFVRLLLDAGADPNYQNRYGEVPLLSAMKANDIEGVNLLMEHGASLDIADADGITPMSFFLSCGPQVTATMQKWIRKKTGDEAPRVEKICDMCKKAEKDLKNCSRCHVARYCSVECQRKHWPTHKKTCQPFSSSNTVILKPFYRNDGGSLMPASDYKRHMQNIPTPATPESHYRPAHVPKGLNQASKNVIIKVQVPMPPAGFPVPKDGSLLIYTKKRDFVCEVRRQDCPSEYDRVAAVVRTKGVGGVKAYFAAELKSKDQLVVKISEVVAEQPF